MPKTNEISGMDQAPGSWRQGISPAVQACDARRGLPSYRIERASGAPFPMAISALIIDDEQLARDELKYLLDQVGEVDVVAQGSNGIEARGADRGAPAGPGLSGCADARPGRLWRSSSG